MTSRYIPPSMRQKTQHIPPPTEFPTLGNYTPKNTNNIAKKTFASLATDWNIQSEEESQRAEFQMEFEKQQLYRETMSNKHFFPGKSRYDHTQVSYNDTEHTKNAQHDEWSVVEHTKYRPPQTDEEKYAKLEAREKEEQRVHAEEEMGWKTENTDWDFRDRRVHS